MIYKLNLYGYRVKSDDYPSSFPLADHFVVHFRSQSEAIVYTLRGHDATARGSWGSEQREAEPSVTEPVWTGSDQTGRDIPVISVYISTHIYIYVYIYIITSYIYINDIIYKLHLYVYSIKVLTIFRFFRWPFHRPFQESTRSHCLPGLAGGQADRLAGGRAAEDRNDENRKQA